MNHSWILGISCFYHDSAACLLRDGTPVGAAAEEVFTRKKHDSDLPVRAIQWLLEKHKVAPSDLQAIVFYDKPLLKFERLLLSHVATFPWSFPQFVRGVPAWFTTKLRLDKLLEQEFGYKGPLIYGQHHLSHAASTFYASGLDEAAILTVDGVGEWASATWGRGTGNTIKLLGEIRFPHSLGLLYSAFTYYLGFKVNSAEYKVMGLAPYGEPRHVDKIKQLIDIKSDGTFRLNMKCFTFDHAMLPFNRRFEEIMGAPTRPMESGPLDQFHKDVARSLQEVVNEVMVNLANRAMDEAGTRDLCLAGGVALNCVANGVIVRNTNVRELFVQPAAGDAGGAMGAALWAWHDLLHQPRSWKMDDPYLGPSYTDDQICRTLDRFGAVYERLDRSHLIERVAELVDQSLVVGWYQGALEWGPRALGHRSILGDPRHPEMRDIINTKIKMREGFRPFAPTVLAEDASEWFELDRPSPHMLLVAPVRDTVRFGPKALPAITHVDGSARIQTLRREEEPLYYDLIAAFKRRTGCGVLINTSMNVRGEPIVNTPEDAFRCFMRTDMDALAIGHFLLLKDRQRPLEQKSAAEEFGLD
jgi:carbamoyltransferase